VVWRVAARSYAMSFRLVTDAIVALDLAFIARMVAGGPVA
jgi:hypothetical protein